MRSGSRYFPSSRARARTSRATSSPRRRLSSGSSAASSRSSSATLVHLLSIGRRRPPGSRSAYSTTRPPNVAFASRRSGGSWPSARASTFSPARPRVDEPATISSRRRRLSAARSSWPVRACSIAFTSASARWATAIRPWRSCVAPARPRSAASRPCWTSRRVSSCARASCSSPRCTSSASPAARRAERGDRVPGDGGREHGAARRSPGRGGPWSTQGRTAAAAAGPAPAMAPAAPLAYTRRSAQTDRKAMRELIHRFASLRVTVVLVVLVLLALAAGTIVESLHGAPAAGRTVYQAPWFRALLAVFALNLTASLVDLWPWGRRRIGYALTHGSMLVILAGGLLTEARKVEGQLQIWEGEESTAVVGGVEPGSTAEPRTVATLPFAVKLDSFEVDYYEGTRRPAQFRSRVVVKDGGTEKPAVIEMNRPLAARRVQVLPEQLPRDAAARPHDPVGVEGPRRAGRVPRLLRPRARDARRPRHARDRPAPGRPAGERRRRPRRWRSSRSPPRPPRRRPCRRPPRSSRCAACPSSTTGA